MLRRKQEAKKFDVKFASKVTKYNARQTLFLIVSSFFPFPTSLGANQKNNARHCSVSGGCVGGKSNSGGGKVTQIKLEPVAPHGSVSQRNALYHGCAGYMLCSCEGQELQKSVIAMSLQALALGWTHGSSGGRSEGMER